MTLQFLQVTTTCKNILSDDWRSFLQFIDDASMTVYEIRGYSYSPTDSLTDAYNKFLEDPMLHQTDNWDWV